MTKKMNTSAYARSAKRKARPLYDNCEDILSVDPEEVKRMQACEDNSDVDALLALAELAYKHPEALVVAADSKAPGIAVMVPAEEFVLTP